MGSEPETLTTSPGMEIMEEEKRTYRLCARHKWLEKVMSLLKKIKHCIIYKKI